MLTEGVGIEHRGETPAAARAGEDRQHLSVGFEHMDFDKRSAVRQAAVTGFAHEGPDAGLLEHVFQTERAEMHRLQLEELVEEAVDLIGSRRLEIAIVRQLHQPALFSAQLPAHVSTEVPMDQLSARRGEIHAAAVIRRLLVRQHREWICDVSPHLRLVAEEDEVKLSAVIGHLAKNLADVRGRDRRSYVTPPQAEIEVDMLRAEKLHRANRPFLDLRERP